MKKIDKLVALIKNKTFNTIVTILFIAQIGYMAYLDNHFPKDIANKRLIPVFIFYACIGLFYGYLFVRVRILTPKENRKTN